MRSERNAIIDRCEAVLASHIVELTSELRGYDAVDLIALIRLGQLPSLRCLIDSDCETHFKPTTMSFGGDAEVSVSWRRPPVIRIAMQFRHQRFEIYYRVTLAAGEAGVEIDLLRFDGRRCAAPSVGELDLVLADARMARAGASF